MEEGVLVFEATRVQRPNEVVKRRRPEVRVSGVDGDVADLINIFRSHDKNHLAGQTDVDLSFHRIKEVESMEGHELVVILGVVAVLRNGQIRFF